MKYIDADKIRAEIERRMVELAKDKYIDLHDTLCRTKELNLLLSFLDTLEEPVSDCHDLEEAAEKFARFYDNGTCDGIAQDCFKAGAEWQKKKIPMPEDTVLFQKGVQEGKRLMMEGAVEGYVTYGSKGAYVESDWLGTYDVEVFGTNGSKVKIIVVKEDEE